MWGDAIYNGVITSHKQNCGMFPYKYHPHLTRLLLPNSRFVLWQYVMIASMLKRPRTPPTNNPALDYQTADSEHLLKRSRPFAIQEEASISTASLFRLLA